MKFTLVLRDKKNALKLSTKSIESFVERIKHEPVVASSSV